MDYLIISQEIKKSTMKSLKRFALIVFSFGLLTSCTSVRVVSDYDQKADFNTYKSYAFYKTGIDKAQISDLDKKRILRAIEAEMGSRGFVKSDNPDVLISIFTKERERVDVYNNFGWGWGGFYSPWAWGPGWGWGWGGYGGWGWRSGWNNNNQVTTTTEGMLFIDLIDTAKKELIWQGSGTGSLNSNNPEKKEARIKEFVSKMLEQFPPEE